VQPNQSSVKQLIQRLTDRKQSCWVLISCGEPDAEGDMPVELYYEGETELACFLLENAKEVLDRQFET